MDRSERLEQCLPAGGRALGLAVTFVLIVGCATASPATPTHPATSVPTTSAPLTPTPFASMPTTSAPITGAPTQSPSATPTQGALTTIAPDADLAALLPTTLAGSPVTVARFDGEDLSDLPDELYGTGGSDPIGNADFGGGIPALAEELDVPLAEVQGAMAYAPDHEPIFAPHAVVAIRLVGADPAAMVDALALGIGGLTFLSGELVPTEETVGGKTVSVLQFSSYSNFFYAIGDVAFIVKLADPDEAENVLRQLP